VYLPDYVIQAGETRIHGGVRDALADFSQSANFSITGHLIIIILGLINSQ
jgi:hypothetical protein